MRVLVCIFEQLVPLSGGGTPRISNVIKAFIRRGHEVYVASAMEVTKDEALKEMGCVDLEPLLHVSRVAPKKMMKYAYAHPLNLLRVVKYARRIRPNIIVSHNTIAGFGALIAKRIEPCCLTILDLTDLLFEYLEDYKRGGWLRLIQWGGRRLEKEVIHRSDKIITISNSMKEILLDYGINESKVEIVCDGVDTKVFNPMNGGSLREKYGRSADNVIVFQGVIDPQDCPRIIVDAAKKVVTKHPKTVFWIIGAGAAIPEMKRNIHRYKLDENFYFSGWVRQEEVASYISASDIGLIVLPDTISARGRVTLKEFEYWACGIPVIAPRLPALQEVIIDGQTGLFYRPQDSQDLSKKIVRLIEDTQLRKRMGEKGMEVVRLRFEWKKLADQFVEKCEALGLEVPS